MEIYPKEPVLNEVRTFLFYVTFLDFDITVSNGKI